MNKVVCNPVWAILICDNKKEQELHHSNLANDFFGSLQKPLPFVFKCFIVLFRFLLRKHLGISFSFL